MSQGGFGKDSGPYTGPRPQLSSANFPRAPSPSPPRPLSQGNDQTLNRGVMNISTYKEHGAQTHQRSPDLLPWVTSSNSRNGIPAEVPDTRAANSTYSRSPDAISNNYRSGRRAQPPLVYPKNQHVQGQHPQTEGMLQRPSLSPVRGAQPRPSSYSTPSPGQGVYTARPMFRPNHMDQTVFNQTRSPTPPSIRKVSPEKTISPPPGIKRPLIDYKDLDAPETTPNPSLDIERSIPMQNAPNPFATPSDKPFTSSHMWRGRTQSPDNSTPLVQENMDSVFTRRGEYQSGKLVLINNASSPITKRTRSPTLSPTSGSFLENPATDLNGNKRASDFQRQSQSSISGQTKSIDISVDKSMQFPAGKRTKLPLSSSSDSVFQESLDTAQETERELLAKAKRLARFKDELSQPVQSSSTVRNQNIPAKRSQTLHERQKFSDDPTADEMGDRSGGNFLSDNEGMVSSSVIVGLCPDMCPESERAERERKGDLDQYERVDGDRNMTSEILAVKKYNRTAEREATLIRPMPILQKTMDYLLNLLSEPYGDRFLGLYNFLWDRMRAIRMDLRMQHIFNLEAITMLEQMIRLHIIAMHELCEYTKGEGFSEGFDAHLNIEQMNKTSVELFQLYDDHRKKGVHVPSEQEFRGYYALLKLDKHPGYKVEPAELSLDLAKMTPEIRQTREVLFARAVARACRTGNFISFFRLANKSSYLQACLMHAHFSKLRTQALSSLHSGLQMNQGIPVAHVAGWLGMQEEEMGELLEYHGFSVKDFEEPYMVKENAFINADTDFPIKKSKLVDRKRSETISIDVSLPSLIESCAAKEAPGFLQKKVPKPTISRTITSSAPTTMNKLQDEEMLDLGTISSPKASIQPSKNKTHVALVTPDEKLVGNDARVTAASPVSLNFPHVSAEITQKRVDSPKRPMFESVFRNSFGRSSKQYSEPISPISVDMAEEITKLGTPRDSAVHTPIPQPMSTEELEDSEEPISRDEDESEELTTSYYDQEVAEAKLRLILRIWKRRTAKKRELREHKQLAANAARSLLSMGPPLWQFEAPLRNYGTIDIDHVMSERYEIQEKSSAVLNPSDVVAAKLREKNPNAECLCWKVVVFSPEEIPHGDNVGKNKATQSWFHSKLMPAKSDSNTECDLLVSSPGLAIWRSWIPSLSGVDLTCCLSVIKSATLEDLNEAITGTGAILFLLSDDVPLERQKKHLHDLVASLPSGSRFPLLILDGSGKAESEASKIAKALGLHGIDESRVIAYNLAFVKDDDDSGKKIGGFFSDERLREGLEWLASESMPQIDLIEMNTRKLVLSHLNPSLEILDGITAHQVGPNDCISAFDEALDNSMKEISAAVDANPAGWPCPEVEMLEQSSDEYRAVSCYLPSVGWSSASRIEALMRALNDSVLPPLGDNLSWLPTGLNTNDDIEIQTLRVENCLVNYLAKESRMMGLALAEKESTIMIQTCTRLELHGSAYYVVPRWVPIFRRIFNWRLVNLNDAEVSSTYVLQQRRLSVPSRRSSDRLDSMGYAYSPPYTVGPLLDELVDVGCHSQVLRSNLTESEVFPLQSIDVFDNDKNDADLRFGDAIVPISNENDDNAVAEENGNVDDTKSSTEANKLSELLDKCNIIQDLIDTKLSLYI
ncbi:SAC3 family protein B [Andrographis paniculata]|uniref:SAC3 family protein B n=1 Tax=Andrographis paniculata TaxID=175694 RepID=UPI0021E72943|nr:SAC3 family protein B [Andrographis paniculata]